MHYKITVSRAVFMSFAVVLLVLISLVCLAPLWHVLMGSLSNPTQVGITQGLILYPLQNLDTHAYSIILTYQRLWNGYLNTFIYIFLQCVLTGVATIVAGYVCTGGSFGACGAAVMPICSTDAAITGRKCLDCRCISVICLAILKTEYDDEPLSAAQRLFFFGKYSRSHKVLCTVEEGQ